jgi:hypothetical protein
VIIMNQDLDGIEQIRVEENRMDSELCMPTEFSLLITQVQKSYGQSSSYSLFLEEIMSSLDGTHSR